MAVIQGARGAASNAAGPPGNDEKLTGVRAAENTLQIGRGLEGSQGKSQHSSEWSRGSLSGGEKVTQSREHSCRGLRLS